MVLTSKSLPNNYLIYSEASDEISRLSPDYHLSVICVCVHDDGVCLDTR